jgi:hypothetical protein
MRNRKRVNFIISIPFIISLASFLLYLRYLFLVKSVGTKNVTTIMEASLVRYRNIAIFCLAVGVFLLFLKTLYDFFTLDTSEVVREEGVLDKISSKTVDNKISYTFDENNIINDLLSNKTLKDTFIGSDVIDMVVKLKNYNKKDKVIEFYDLTKKPVKVEKEVTVISEPVKKEYIVKKEEIHYDKKYFKKCFKCNSIIAKDAPICVNCGTVLKEDKTKLFNPVRFALNMIIILLCIILLLLCVNKITRQSEINKSNLNITNISK